MNVSHLMDRRSILLGLGALPLSACATPAAKTFVSQEDPLARFRLKAGADGAQWRSHLHSAILSGSPQVLALSGGGEDGAFGAGALNGLSQIGQRPRYDIVTGVSTGALIAPFAFLGSEYDDRLRHIFLEHEASDIMRFNPVSAVRRGGLFDTDRLAGLIKDFTPPSILTAIAKRHDAGARLFMVTSNIETSDAIVWNMGEIAKAQNNALFRSVMRASGALPGLFAPVEISYSSPNGPVRETHVDGGVHMQFLAAPQAAYHAKVRKARGGHVYVLINNTLNPAPERASTSALGMSQQAMSAMVRASAMSDLNSTRLLAQRHNFGFSMTSVGADSGIVYDPLDRFSAKYMAAMFDYGFERARNQRLWQS